MTDPHVLLIIPTHRHPESLERSIRSALAQTFTDFTLAVIGDGVEDDTRDVVRSLQRDDSRIVFHDLPKGPRHGEIHRHQVISESRSTVIGYHGDDDLLLPHHLETMLALLNGRDFVHPLPIFVKPDGNLVFKPTDLSLKACIQWHLAEPPRNAISLTGVVHTRASYERLPHGWRTTPTGRWTDHYMWQQFFRLPGFVAATSVRSTTLKVVGGVAGSGPEVADWIHRSATPGFSIEWDERVATTVLRASAKWRLRAP